MAAPAVMRTHANSPQALRWFDTLSLFEFDSGSR